MGSIIMKRIKASVCLGAVLFAALLSVLAVPAMAQTPPAQTFNLYSVPQADQTFTDPAGNTTVFHTLGTAQNPVQTGTITFTPAGQPPPPPPPPPPPANIVVSNPVGGGCTGSIASTTCTSPAYSVTAGHQYIVAERGYGGSGQQVTGIAGTGLSCALAPGSGSTGGARTAPGDAVKVELWRCSASSTASTTIKATWSAAAQWTDFAVIDVTGLAASPDDGVASVAHGTGPSLTVATNGSTTQANELIVAAFYDGGSMTGMSVGAGYTLAANQMAYSLSNAAGPNSVSVTITGNGSGSSINAVIAAFKHG